MASRLGEFPFPVYQAVKDRNVCEECGCGPDENDPWHVHHLIFLEYGIETGIPLAILQSLANGSLMHRSCHYHYHNEYPTQPLDVVEQVYKRFDASRVKKEDLNRRVKRIS